MKLLVLLGVALAAGFLQSAAQPKAPGCDALGNVQFVCGLVGPEDLVVVPGEQMIIASGDAAPGAITLIHVKDKSTSPLYPSASLEQRLDAKTYDSCPAPMSEPSGAQRRLSRRKPTGISSRLTGVWPRENRMNV